MAGTTAAGRPVTTTVRARVAGRGSGGRIGRIPRGLALVAVRSLAFRRGRTLLTLIGIGLGVGLLFASIATSAAIDRSVDVAVGDTLGRADLRMVPLAEAGLGPESLAAVAGAEGVQVASPELERRAYLAPADLAEGADPATLMKTMDAVTVVGVDPDAYRVVHTPDLVAGTWLAAGDTGAVISERLAGAASLGVGDTVTVLAGPAATPTPLPIVGIVRGAGPLLGGDGRLVLAALDTVEVAFGTTAVSRLDIVAAAGIAVPELERGLEAALTFQPYVLSTRDGLAASLRASTADFGVLSALVAALALFVAAFLIFNTLSMTVAERVRDIGLLRAAGMTRRRIGTLFLAQAGLIAAGGTLIGLGVGILLAALIAYVVGTVGSVPIAGLAIPARGVLLTILVAFGVTLAAAAEPARRAAAIPPVEALRARVDASLLRPRLRWIGLVFAVVAVAGLAAWPGNAGSIGLVRPLGVYAILIAGTLLLPLLLRPLGALAGLPFRAIAPLEERIGRRSLLRDPERSTLTLGALTIGVATIAALAVTGANLREAALGRLADVVPGDVVVASVRPLTADEGVGDQLAAAPGVARVSPIGRFDLALDGVRVDAAAVVGTDLLGDGRLRLAAGDRDAALGSLDAGGTAIVPRSLADQLGLQLGQTVALLGTATATLPVTVSGIADHTLPGPAGEAVLVAWRDAEALGAPGIDLFAVRFAPGARAGAEPGLDDLARGLLLEPRSIDSLGGAAGGSLARIFDLFDALALIAVLVAGLGIVNTLTMSVVERVREIGLLRAIGMTRRRIARMVVVEAGMIGLVGVVAGLALGLASALGMTALSVGLSGTGLVVPWLEVGAAALLALVVALAAAWQPARIAAGVPIVRSLRYD